MSRIAKPLITIAYLLLAVIFLPLFPAQAQERPVFPGHLAYSGAGGNIWVLAGGGEPLQITQDGSDGHPYASPRWSPDGKMLAFCQRDPEVPENSRLLFARSGDWQPFALAEDVYCRSLPAGVIDWSPNGRQIAYARASSLESNAQERTAYGIWTVDVVTGEQKELVPAPGGIPLNSPQWAPNEGWLKTYEVFYREGAGILRTWQPGGELVNWLELGKDLFPGSSDWSPDGSQVVFDQVTYQGFPGAGLYTAQADGSGLHRIYRDGQRAAMHPLWGPGGWIAFESKQYKSGGRKEPLLSALNLESNSLLDISRGTPARLVGWVGGEQLLYAQEGEGFDSLYLYDFTTESSSLLVAQAQADAGWTSLETLPAPSEATPPSRINGVTFQEGLMAYLAPGYQLKLRNPASGEEIPLSAPMSAASFLASKSGQRLVYGRTWLALEFLPEGDLGLIETPLPAAPMPGTLRWSPDENRLAFQDADGRAWMAALGGGAVEIPQASGPAAWSFTGEWVSYCRGQGALWVLSGSLAPHEIASGVDCAAQWSPSQNLLAYTRPQADSGQAAGVYLYDPAQGESKLLKADAVLDSWSPDGRLLAVLQPDASGASATAYLLDPGSEAQLAVGRVRRQSAGVQTWTRTGSGYLYGPYRVPADLRAVDRVADTLFSAAADGSRLLVGLGSGKLVTVACLDTASGQRYDITTTDLTALPPADAPGIWGQLSPNGEWLTLTIFDQGSFQHLLSRCDGSDLWQQTESGSGQAGVFSEDSRWYLRRGQDANGASDLVLHDLNLGQQVPLPAVSGTALAWLRPRATTPPGYFTITGKVSGPGGVPVAGAQVLLDGKKATQAGADGSYVIAGLEPGNYSLSAQNPGLSFTPAERQISLPPDASGIDFQVLLPTETPAAAPTAVPPTPEPPAPSYAGWLDLLRSPSMLWLLAGCGGVLLVLLLVVLWFRRRKRRQVSPAPLPSAPLAKGRLAQVEAQPQAVAPQAATEDAGDTQPVRVAPAVEPDTAPPPRAVDAVPMPAAEAQAEGDMVGSKVQAWLQLGIEQIKRGELKAGIDQMHRVVAAEPENGNAWLWLGWAAAQQRDRRTAERCFRRAQRLGHPRAEEGLRWLRGG